MKGEKLKTATIYPTSPGYFLLKSFYIYVSRVFQEGKPEKFQGEKQEIHPPSTAGKARDGCVHGFQAMPGQKFFSGSEHQSRQAQTNKYIISKSGG